MPSVIWGYSITRVPVLFWHDWWGGYGWLAEQIQMLVEDAYEGSWPVQDQKQQFEVTWHEPTDSFRIEINRYVLNMLQRALRRCPYDEISQLRNAMVAALLRRLVPGARTYDMTENIRCDRELP